MSDEEDKEGKEESAEKDAKTSFRERNKQERLDLIKSENEVIKGMAKENDRKEELLDRAEALADAKQLSGDSDAGQPSKKVEETPQEYAKALYTGT